MCCCFFVFACLITQQPHYYLQTLRHIRFSALFRVCVCGGGGGGVALFVFLRRRLTSLAEGPRCIRQRQLLLSIPSYYKVYIHLHQLVVDQTFSPRQTMQERTTVNDKVDMLWQLHIKMFGLHAFRKQPFNLFFIYKQCMHFLKCMVPFSSEVINFLSTSFVKSTMVTCSLSVLSRYWITC